jgi:F420-dependent oxidoreductase-like protein
MRFSVWLGAGMPWEALRDEALHAESVGWDGLWIADHFMGMDGSAGPQECMAQLAALAGTVPRVRLGPLVCGNTYRHPAILASQAAAVDRISGGRFVLGIGTGWQQNEHDAYGIDMPAPKVRLDMLEEACQVVKPLLSGERVTFKGEHYQLDDAVVPPPADGQVPLLIGGGGEKRTLRIAAQYADEWNAWTEPTVLEHKLSVLRQHCDAVGRDPGQIKVSTQAMLFLSTDEEWLKDKRGMGAIAGTPKEVVDIIGAYQEAGADEIIVPDFTMGSLPRRKDTCDLFINEVASNFR